MIVVISLKYLEVNKNITKQMVQGWERNLLLSKNSHGCLCHISLIKFIILDFPIQKLYKITIYVLRW